MFILDNIAIMGGLLGAAAALFISIPITRGIDRLAARIWKDAR